MFDQADQDIWNIIEQQEKLLLSKQSQTQIVCVVCASKEIYHQQQLIICKQCGYQEHQQGQAEIFDDNDQSRQNNAINIFYPQQSLGSPIQGAFFSKIKQIDMWGRTPYSERSLKFVLSYIEKCCDTHQLKKSIIDDAKVLYNSIRKSIHHKGKNEGKNIIIRGINRKQTIAACVFYGANLQKQSRSPKEIADIFGIKLTQVTKGCRKFLQYLYQNKFITDISPTHGQDFIERFSFQLQLDKKAVNIAIQISSNASKLDIATDHQPTSLAIAAIILACMKYNIAINRKQIIAKFKISDVTITKTLTKLEPFMNILADDLLTNKAKQLMDDKFEQYCIETLNQSVVQPVYKKLYQQYSIPYNTQIRLKRKYVKKLKLNQYENFQQCNNEIIIINPNPIIKKQNLYEQPAKIIDDQPKQLRQRGRPKKIRIFTMKQKQENDDLISTEDSIKNSTIIN